MRRGRQVKLFLKREKMVEVALISPNEMAVLPWPGPLPDGRRSGGDEGLGSRLATRTARKRETSERDARDPTICNPWIPG